MVPSYPAMGFGAYPSSSTISPFRKSAIYAISEHLSLLVTVILETKDIEARASPLKPKLLTFLKSLKLSILLVANLSQSKAKSSFYKQ